MIGFVMIIPCLIHQTYATNINALLVASVPDDLDDSGGDIDSDSVTNVQDNMGLGTTGSENGSASASAAASASASASM